MVKIREIPMLDRPRERFTLVGAHNLSNEELLAIILKTGTKQISAKELASNILSKFDDITKLKSLTLQQLTQIQGIGKVKAIELLASIELGRRINSKVDTINNVKITNSEIVYNYYQERLSDKMQEQFYCLYLDNSKKVICEKLLFIGSLNFSLVNPREVFKEAYLSGATSIICIHNHPSGNVLPSSEDFYITSKLVEVGKILGIVVNDHIIIGRNNYYSFFENNDI